ncbi:MAG: diguanylate cyclase [Gammaproteobacteria bacterium]|nr:diguanylate cyclase [Gammaproteobacteria bacterium]
MMFQEIFEKLTSEEINSSVKQLEKAVEKHQRWLSNLNTALICGKNIENIDTSADAHQDCDFGQWYRNFTTIETASIPLFGTLFDIHKELHQEASRLLKLRQQGGEIIAHDYEHITIRSELVRNISARLADHFRENIRIATKVINQVFEHTLEGVIITDANGTILNVNRAFSTITGYSSEEVIGKRPSLLASGKHDKSFYDAMYRNLHLSGSWNGEITNRRKNGELFTEHLSITAIRDHRGMICHFVGILSDITAEQLYKNRLYKHAHFDQLTQLHNRLSLYEELGQALHHAKRDHAQLGIMFIDLDGFKQVNDTLGHGVGDALLQETAKRLKETLRASDIIGRMGGDEFVVVTASVFNEEGIAAVAAKILHSLQQPHHFGSDCCKVAASIGISIFPIHGNTPEELIRCADSAMYESKHRGKGCYTLCSKPVL